MTSGISESLKTLGGHRPTSLWRRSGCVDVRRGKVAMGSAAGAGLQAALGEQVAGSNMRRGAKSKDFEHPAMASRC
jgi:hypothetical protein